jgi:hypothetical protein
MVLTNALRLRGYLQEDHKRIAALASRKLGKFSHSIMGEKRVWLIQSPSPPNRK